MSDNQPSDDHLDDLGELEPPAAPPEDADASDGGESPGPMYPDVHTWVTDYLAHTYARDVTEPGTRHHWCSEWWRHPEALDRLDALWRAWETLRRDPTTGPATWWTHYADPAMAVLLSPDGPFTRCRRTQHAGPDTIVPPLPATPAPTGLFG